VNEEHPGRVVREVVLPVSPNVVWESLTRPEHLSTWLGSRVELDARQGGVLRLEADGAVRFGVVEAARPSEYLAFRWRPLVVGPDGSVPGPGTRVEFLLEPKDGGTRLRVVETLLSAFSLVSATAAAEGNR
jgi:uncharacterized protein YndB with AHSA1/START domain